MELEGLKNFLKKLNNNEYPEYIRTEDSWTDTGKNLGPLYGQAVEMCRTDNKDEKGNRIYNLDFSGFDGWKIISYWYRPFVQFLRDVAPFVDGEVNLEFENHDEAGWIEFKDGECIIHAGSMEYTKYSPEGLRETLQAMPKEVKDVLARRMKQNEKT